jgi:hypothetical protein
LFNLQEPPGFKLGDGKWLLKSTEGDVVSAVNTLYKVNDVNFDVIHLNHKPITEHLLRFTPLQWSVPYIQRLLLEEPVLTPEIKKIYSY